MIPLNKHSKIWIHPQGIIPVKIYQRLLFQRQVRPDDRLTLFVNAACLKHSKDIIDDLVSKGVKIVNINEALSKRKDDEYLVVMIKNILAKLEKTADVRDSVFASDLLRMTNLVQDEGLYSDTDVLFLNKNSSEYLQSPYLFGAHEGGSFDIHILGIDSRLRDKFQQGLIEMLKEYFGDVPPAPDSEKLIMMAGVGLLPNIDEITKYMHTCFAETKDNIVSGKDDSWCGGEKFLHEADSEDELLTEAKRRLGAQFLRPQGLI